LGGTFNNSLVGNYERNVNAPSIEMMASIAKVLGVSIDYLIGEGKLAQYDKEIIKRIEDIQELDKDTQSKLFFLIHNVVLSAFMLRLIKHARSLQPITTLC